MRPAALSILASLAALSFLAALAPPPWGAGPPGYGPGAARAVLAADGSELARWDHPDRRCGPWLAPGQINRWVRAAALAAEDRRFYWHPGVDPLALLRAAWQNLIAGRIVSGGSTITMQLARLQRPARRSLAAKLAQAGRALWLEALLSKEEILCRYLNLAPFGGPLVGLGAASRALLGKEAWHLSPSEAALLLALPRDPARLLRPAYRGRLRARRQGILRAMARAGHLSDEELAQALAAPLRLRPLPLPPVAAPHFSRTLLARLGPGGPQQVATYLDPLLQQEVARLAANSRRRLRYLGLRQAAVVVLRNRDRAILAWVGSADFAAPDGGQVDGVLARRQPGSALKPFVYALALMRGRTLADRLVDEPLTLATGSGTFRPSDYDGGHRGLVRLRVALASSLNLPALRLAAELTPAAVLGALRGLGLGLNRSAEHYGLGLALGNGEVSLLALTTAYAALAEGGVYLPARWWQGQKATAPRRVISAAASRLVADALADDRARVLGFGRHSLLELPFPAAVKTGTSQQHRDNWCLGFSSRYTVGVWVGNFEGRPMTGVSGLRGAGPLWRQVMLLLHRREPGRLPPWPPGVKPALVCADSGRRAGPGCQRAFKEYFAPGTLPPPAPKAQAPPQATPRLGLSLISPAPGAVYALDPEVPPALQVLHCQVAANGPVTRVRWRLNGATLPGGAPLQRRLPLRAGRHRLELEARGPGGEARLAVRFLVLGPRAPKKGTPR